MSDSLLKITTILISWKLDVSINDHMWTQFVCLKIFTGYWFEGHHCYERPRSTKWRFASGKEKKKPERETDVTSWRPEFTRIAHSKSSAENSFTVWSGAGAVFVFTVFEFRRATRLRFYSAIIADRLDTATRSNVGVIASWHSKGPLYHKQYEKEVAEITTIIVPNSENAATAIFGTASCCTGYIYSRYKILCFARFLSFHKKFSGLIIIISPDFYIAR